jgi:hypothetical protein
MERAVLESWRRNGPVGPSLEVPDDGCVKYTVHKYLTPHSFHFQWRVKTRTCIYIAHFDVTSILILPFCLSTNPHQELCYYVSLTPGPIRFTYKSDGHI